MLEFTIYLTRFIANYAELINPLTSMLCENLYGMRSPKHRRMYITSGRKYYHRIQFLKYSILPNKKSILTTDSPLHNWETSYLKTEVLKYFRN